MNNYVMLNKKWYLSMQNLIRLGARKFGIVSVPPLGCCPSQRIKQANGECLEELNNQARAFFSTMEPLLVKLRLQYKGIKYSLGNAVNMSLNVIDNAPAFSKLFSVE